MCLFPKKNVGLVFFGAGMHIMNCFFEYTLLLYSVEMVFPIPERCMRKIPRYHDSRFWKIMNLGLHFFSLYVERKQSMCCNYVHSSDQQTIEYPSSKKIKASKFFDQLSKYRNKPINVLIENFHT